MRIPVAANEKTRQGLKLSRCNLNRSRAYGCSERENLTGIETRRPTHWTRPCAGTRAMLRGFFATSFNESTG